MLFQDQHLYKTRYVIMQIIITLTEGALLIFLWSVFGKYSKVPHEQSKPKCDK